MGRIFAWGMVYYSADVSKHALAHYGAMRHALCPMPKTLHGAQCERSQSVRKGGEWDEVRQAETPGEECTCRRLRCGMSREEQLSVQNLLPAVSGSGTTGVIVRIPAFLTMTPAYHDAT